MNIFDNWLEYSKQNSNYKFTIVNVTEKNSSKEDELIKYLQKEVLLVYRKIEFYKFNLAEESEENIIKYVKEQVIPKDENPIDRNIRQGDWGEVLAALIVLKFQNLQIPINKLQWKFNKNKSVFGTDLIAFNKGEQIKDIYYYEIKTRLNPQNKEGSESNKHFIAVLAYKTLLIDSQSPTESIADFLERLFFEKEEYEKALKFKDIIKHPENYQKKYEVFLIVEKNNFIKKMREILEELNNLSPKLDPLNITIVLIDNLEKLINRTWENIEKTLIEILKNE